MKKSRVSRRYALALFQAAQEKNKLVPVEADFHILKKAYGEAPEFRRLIDSPIISNRVKRESITAIFKSRLNSLTLSFLELLVEKNREAELPDIISEFHRLLDDSRGVVRGEVVSAIPMQPTQLENLKRKLDARTGKNVVLETKHDSGLLGGFVVRLNDQVIDVSLRNQLRKMHQRLTS